MATSRNATSVTAEYRENKNLLALNVDITKETDVKNAVEKTIERFGSIDVAVNNAGYGLAGALEELSDAYQMATGKMKANIEAFETWQSSSTSTDFVANT